MNSVKINAKQGVPLSRNRDILSKEMKESFDFDICCQRKVFVVKTTLRIEREEI